MMQMRQQTAPFDAGVQNLDSNSFKDLNGAA